MMQYDNASHEKPMYRLLRQIGFHDITPAPRHMDMAMGTDVIADHPLYGQRQWIALRRRYTDSARNSLALGDYLAKFSVRFDYPDLCGCAESADPTHTAFCQSSKAEFGKWFAPEIAQFYAYGWYPNEQSERLIAAALYDIPAMARAIIDNPDYMDWIYANDLRPNKRRKTDRADRVSRLLNIPNWFINANKAVVWDYAMGKHNPMMRAARCVVCKAYGADAAELAANPMCGRACASEGDPTICGQSRVLPLDPASKSAQVAFYPGQVAKA